MELGENPNSPTRREYKAKPPNWSLGFLIKINGCEMWLESVFDQCSANKLACHMTDDKYLSEYPLPGGVEQYFDTLIALLRYIRDNTVTIDDLTKWIFDTFPNASGQIAVNGYIAVLSRSGLWLQQEDQIRLTPEGTAIVTKSETEPSEARRILLGIKYRDFFGYDIIFRLLDSGPKTLDEIHAQLNEFLDDDWKSKNQATFRVNWLRSLGYIEKHAKEYRLTTEGRDIYKSLEIQADTHPNEEPAKPHTSSRDAVSPLALRATEIADRLDRLAVAGGDGKEFEIVTEEALSFLGFETQLISGPGNPDVLATAAMGERTYRVLIDSKSRASGLVQQNDINFLVLDKQKKKASADFVAIVASGFAGGQLQEFAVSHSVRLISTADIRELLIAHADSAFPLDVLRRLFQGGGATDEGVLSEILTSADSKTDVTLLARRVFAAVKEYQDKAGKIHVDSLYYILRCEHPLATIKLAVDFLISDLIAVLGETDKGSLYTRVSAVTLASRLQQLARTLDLRENPVT